MSGHIEAPELRESRGEVMAAENGNGSTLANLANHDAESVSMDKRTVALNIAEAFRLLSDAPSAFADCKNCRAAYYQHGATPLTTRFQPCDHFTDRNEERAKAARESDLMVLGKIESLL